MGTSGDRDAIQTTDAADAMASRTNDLHWSTLSITRVVMARVILPLFVL